MCWQHKLQESQSMGWQNVGTKIKCLMKVQKLQWETWKGKGRSRGQGRRDGRQRGCSKVLHADNGTRIQSSDWSEHVPKSACLQGGKKAPVMNSTVMTQFQTPSFIPIGLQGTLLKNLLPFHLSSNMTCFAALLQTHDINSTDQPFQYLENILLSWILAEQTPARFSG